MPAHEELVRSLFAYDLIGFQTVDDLDRFRSHVRRAYDGIVRGEAIQAFGRELRAGTFPIGIDVDRFHRFAFTTPGSREFTRMRRVLRGRDQFIGVDRLDYSKGLLRRMDAFGRYLEAHPKAHGHVILLQVAPLSRGELSSYRDFRLELDREAARVNGRFGRFDSMTFSQGIGPNLFQKSVSQITNAKVHFAILGKILPASRKWQIRIGVLANIGKCFSKKNIIQPGPQIFG